MTCSVPGRGPPYKLTLCPNALADPKTLQKWVEVTARRPGGGGEGGAVEVLTTTPPDPSAPAWCPHHSRPTLSPARILKEAMTWSAVSVSAVSRDIKSMKAWNVTTPRRLGSTMLMMRANSASPWREEPIPGLSSSQPRSPLSMDLKPLWARSSLRLLERAKQTPDLTWVVLRA